MNLTNDNESMDVKNSCMRISSKLDRKLLRTCSKIVDRMWTFTKSSKTVFLL